MERISLEQIENYRSYLTFLINKESKVMSLSFAHPSKSIGSLSLNTHHILVVYGRLPLRALRLISEESSPLSS